MELVFTFASTMPKNKIHAFEFKYEGDFKSLDALTVLHTQINFVTLINEIKDHKFPEIKLDVNLKGVEKGSLDINHIIEVAAVSGMFVLDQYGYISTIFDLLGDIIKIKKFLKGKKADSTQTIGDRITINFNGDNVTIHQDAFKLYQHSPVISNSLSNTSRLLMNEKEIEYIQVSEKSRNKKLLRIDNDDFETLGEENPYLINRTDEQIVKNQILFIKKPNLFPDKRRKWVWELIHRGRDIKAVIVDEFFKKRINEGLKVGQGDRLQADLKIYYKFDERFNTYLENNKYEVSNITNIIERTSETKFDF